MKTKKTLVHLEASERELAIFKLKSELSNNNNCVSCTTKVTNLQRKSRHIYPKKRRHSLVDLPSTLTGRVTVDLRSLLLLPNQDLNEHRNKNNSQRNEIRKKHQSLNLSSVSDNTILAIKNEHEHQNQNNCLPISLPNSLDLEPINEKKMKKKKKKNRKKKKKKIGIKRKEIRIQIPQEGQEAKPKTKNKKLSKKQKKKHSKKKREFRNLKSLKPKSSKSLKKKSNFRSLSFGSSFKLGKKDSLSISIKNDNRQYSEPTTPKTQITPKTPTTPTSPLIKEKKQWLNRRKKPSKSLDHISPISPRSLKRIKFLIKKKRKKKKVQKTQKKLKFFQIDLSNYQFLQLLTDFRLELFSLILENAMLFPTKIPIGQYLFNVYEWNQTSLDILKFTLFDEVQKTDRSRNLFRCNSISTKLLTVFSKYYGKEYVKKVLNEPVLSIIEDCENLEVDDVLVEEDQGDLKYNQEKLKTKVKFFFEKIFSSSEDCPKIIKEICRYIRNIVKKKFPEMELTSIGAFLFLRFICPAIAAPKAYQIVDCEITPRADRALMLTTKIIQISSNNTKFSEASYMRDFNSFISLNKANMNSFFDTISSESYQKEISKMEKTIAEEEVLNSSQKIKELLETHFTKFKDNIYSLKQKILFN
ncbi:ras gtpase-activating protein [Anaeramoeba flamelloides]|uniref:Ras gtpase-activating protein n=1 Tax=Anaeramoeba flamelloides TaxID=1746091 RepID=A0AAV7YLP0_9EUKA|nr:ras gtpase-activating protein [Anaeramoeba flamelloides]